MATPSLRIISGPAAGQSMEVDRELVIGRSGADVTINDPELSRRHVAVRPVEHGLEIEDLGSLNGTFVNGKRLGTPLTVSAPVTVKLGVSEVALEVPERDVTRARRTVEEPAGPVVAADAPAPRGPERQDVTAQRQVPAPQEVTAPRAVVSPDVTRERAVPAPAGPADPAAAGPPPVAHPAVDPPAPSPPPTADPDGEPAPEEPESRSAARKRVPLILAGVAALAALVLAIVLLSGGDEETKKRTVRMTLELSAVTEEEKARSEQRPGPQPIKWVLFGRARGEPFGTGTVTVFVTLQPGGPPPGAPEGKPPPGGTPRAALVTPKFGFRFPNGTIFATERLQSRRVGGGIEFSGTGRIISGTGDFEGANGQFTVTGGRPRFDEPLETIEWRGTVEY